MINISSYLLSIPISKNKTYNYIINNLYSNICSYYKIYNSPYQKTKKLVGDFPFSNSYNLYQKRPNKHINKLNLDSKFEFLEIPRTDYLTIYLNLDANFKNWIWRNQIIEMINWPSKYFSMPILKLELETKLMEYSPNQISIPNSYNTESTKWSRYHLNKTRFLI